MRPFAVWAPTAGEVTVRVDGRERPMEAGAGGWWTAPPESAGHGTRYAFRVDGGEPCPDPRSLWQPDGVHAPSALYDHTRHAWADAGWAGRPLAGGVFYEVHVGTFTPEGTLAAAIGRLDHLVELGITHVELMPLAAFDGPHGWGYDGVHLWAVHQPYGGPDALKAFVDACHARGLAVVLDVVYNHLGPSGNRLAQVGPYFTDQHHTPWGAAVNLDGPHSDGVREWIIANARSWLVDFHLDGLRLDAVHALRDDRAVHILEELSAEVDAWSAALGRPLPLIAESDRNDPATVTPRAAGGRGIHAQWNDDLHHALHALITGERDGYYGDFGALGTLAHALTRAFVHDGGHSTFRGRRHGRPVDTARTPGWRFVCSLQTHDQVGNRALGDRLSPALDPRLLRIGAGLLLTAPSTPMLFMGEEWAAATPWRYFTSFPDDELGRAVSEGRRGEFARHGWDTREVPDPQDSATFTASRLDWDEPGREPHRSMLAWYRALIALRRARPDLADPRLDRVRCDVDEDAATIVVHRGGLRVVANLAGAPRTVTLDAPVLTCELASEDWSAAAGTTAPVLPARTLAILTVGGAPA